MLLVVMTALIAPAWASPGSCLTPQPLDSTVVGAGNGCTFVDNTFSNFNVGTPTGAGDSTWPVPDGTGVTSNILLTASGPGPTVVDFATSGAGSSGLTCNASTWCMPENGNAASQTIDYYAQTTGNYYGLGLDDGALQPGAIHAGSVITTEEAFCLGSTAVSGCATADYGYVEISATSQGSSYTYVYTVCAPGASGCSVTMPGSADITFATPQTEVAIEDTVSIAAATGGTNAVFIDAFDNTFDDAVPEPSTLILLGTSLAGIGLFRARRKKA